MRPHSVCSWVIVLKLALSCLSFALVKYAFATGNSHFLAGKSFELRSIVLKTTPRSQVEYKIHEKYSTGQHRARLGVKSNLVVDQKRRSNLYESIYFSDTKLGILLHQSGTYSFCEQVQLEEVHHGLGLGFIESLEESSSLNDYYVIGPTKLILLVNRYRSELFLLKQSTVRNIPCNEYELVLKNKAKLLVYFQKSDKVIDDSSIPLRIIYVDTKQQQHPDTIIYVIDYSQVKLLLLSSLSSTPTRQVENGLVALDEFVFTLIGHCSPALKATQTNLLQSRPLASSKFSFRAQIDLKVYYDFITFKRHDELIDRTRAFIAYDGQLNSMRVDILDAKSSSIMRAQQLFNFKLNRMYHILDRAIQSGRPLSTMSPVDELLVLSADATTNHHEALGENTQCMVTMIPEQELDIKLGLSKLLLGADGFIYMGRAQVRGIQALVYEAPETKLPFWVEQPVGYVEGVSSRTKVRPPEEVDGTVMTTLVYFGLKDDQHPPLMIEIYRRNAKQSIIYDKRTIIIYDFVWDTIEASGMGVHPAEMFSLKDHCSAATDAKQHGDVSMVMEHYGKFSSEANIWLQSTPLRNLAVLGALQQDLQLPATMIYDLESKLVEETGQTNLRLSKEGKRGPLQRLFVSFKNSDHTKLMPKLFYLGLGIQVSNSLLRSFRVSSFYSCYMLASHRRADIYFGYIQHSRECLILLDPIDYTKTSPDEIDTNPTGFQIKQEGFIELYRVFHRTDIHSLTLGGWTKGDSYIGARYVWLDKRMFLRYNEQDFGRYAFVITRVHVKENEPSPVVDEWTRLGNNSATMRNAPFSRLDGFSLTLDSNGDYNELIREVPLTHSIFWNQLASHAKIAPTEPQETVPMNPDQCRAICLTRPECHSYSVCLRNYQTECIISKLSFTGPNIIRQLELVNHAHQGAPIKMGARVEIEVEKDQIGEQQDRIIKVQLIKHSGCAIHNKIYMNLFREQNFKIKATLSGAESIRAVESREICASTCALRNYDLLRQHVIESSATIGAMLVDRDEKTMNDPEATFEQVNKFKNLFMNNMCFGFMYLSQMDVINLDDEHRNHFYKQAFGDKHKQRTIYSGGGSSLVAGYCIIDEMKQQTGLEPSGYDKLTDHDQILWFEPDIYNFMSSSLYEEQYGIGMLGAPMTDHEEEAFKRARFGLSVDESHLVALKEFTQRGDNSQVVINGDKHSCALICLMQSVNPWPSCRSFDVIIDKVNEQRISRCRLNSITLKQALAQQRLHSMDNSTNKADDPSKQVWHYEPRAGFVSDVVGNSLGKLRLTTTQQDDIFTGQRQHSSLAGIGAIVLLGLASGLILGVSIFARLRSTRQSTFERSASLNSARVLSMPLEELDSLPSERCTSNDQISGRY